MTFLLRRVGGLVKHLITKNYSNNIAMAKNGVSLQKVITELEELAPLKYAESWDNVGLLIEPYTPK